MNIIYKIIIIFAVFSTELAISQDLIEQTAGKGIILDISLQEALIQNSKFELEQESYFNHISSSIFYYYYITRIHNNRKLNNVEVYIKKLHKKYKSPENNPYSKMFKKSNTDPLQHLSNNIQNIIFHINGFKFSISREQYIDIIDNIHKEFSE